MKALSGQQILAVWDVAVKQHPIERALSVLSVALPQVSPDDLAQLTVGQRDACLLGLRQATFGSRLASRATCPQCQESLEFALSIDQLLVAPEAIDLAQPNPVQQVELGDYQIQFRLPDSRDLAIVRSCADATTAYQTLIQRCVIHLTQAGAAIPVAAVPPETVTQLAHHLSTCDPQAEILLDLDCPACQHHWQLVFDIESFFWQELHLYAQRLLREVHLLARAYSWPEAEILHLSPSRRAVYLSMVTE